MYLVRTLQLALPLVDSTRVLLLLVALHIARGKATMASVVPVLYLMLKHLPRFPVLTASVSVLEINFRAVFLATVQWVVGVAILMGR